MKYFTILIIGLASLSFLGCEKDSTKGIAKVHWDRDMCARCVMVVSDRHNSIQVQNPQTKKSYMFDDIGCMVLWFKEENISWSEEALVWVTDVSTGKWIDAREASYTTGNITPMAFGFSAYQTKENIKDAKEIINYGEVLKRVQHKKMNPNSSMMHHKK